MDYKDRHVVVTGGTGALGRAVVARLLEAGATLHLPNRDARTPKSFPHADHPRLTLRTGIDLTKEKDVRDFYAALPRLWASVHLAGGFAMASLEQTGADDFQRMMDMNARTCFLCCREAAATMRRNGRGGRIVNVAARPALEPRSGAGMAAYTASKAAVAALSVALAQELLGAGILVNAVVPSVIDTPANREAMPKADHAVWPKPAEIAETIAFLASPQNKVTRGGLVPVYGLS